MLCLAFKDINPCYSIKVRFRYDGDLLDLRRLKSKTKIFTKYIRETQYADGIAMFTTDGTALQCLSSAYSNLSLKMGLTINIKKTETMSVGEQLDFYIDGHKLKRVDRFKYLGSYVTKDCKLDDEITARIQAASCAMERLRDRVFDCRDLTVETKLKVYNQCIIQLMMYGSETWTLYRHHIKLLRTIQQRHLDQFLRSSGITLSRTMRYWITQRLQILRLFSLETDCVGWVTLHVCQCAAREGTSLWSIRRWFKEIWAPPS